jgi:3-oxoacyl-[acyl-carrier-protein] synthase III
MKLTGIDCQIPSRQIFNEDIVELVKCYSVVHYNHNLTELEALIKKFLFLTGIESRFWRKKNEKPIDLIKCSVDNSLRMANIDRRDIDLVIYSSIDRGFIEPANASFICKALGLNNVRSFDIVDACMGWASAVQVANSFLESSPSINSVLIINAEFPMDNKGSVLPNNFTICDNKELRWKSASFTLGEAASACVFQKDTSVDCKFEFIENPQNAELCNISLANFEKYIVDSQEKYPFPNLNFFAHSSSLLQNGMNPAITVLRTLMNKLNYNPKIIFPHSVSDKIIKDASTGAGVQSLIYSTFSKLGNLATASVPSSIKKALSDKLIHENEKAIAWIASAGMKFSAFEIQL